MSKPSPRWTVPIASSGVGATIEIDDHGNVELELWTPNSEVGPDTLTAVEATQIGMALCDAGREAGQLAVKRSTKQNRRQKPTNCASCGEDAPLCPKSKRACGHHCNHSWSHDHCCWCGEEFGES